MSEGNSGKWSGAHWIRPAKRAEIYERDGWMCVYCGAGPRSHHARKLSSVILSLDHLIPRSEGGGNGAENLVCACKSCNSQRQARPWREYANGGAVERIEFLITQPLDIELGKVIIASLEGSEIEDAR